MLRQSVAGQRRHIATGAALAVGHQAGEALVPVLIGVVIDQAVSDGTATALLGWLLLLAAVFTGLSVSFRFALRAGERAAEQAAHELRRRLATRVLDPRGGAETGRLAGALVTIATGDARRVGTVNTVIPAGVGALAGLLVSAVALLRVSVPLGLLVLLGTPPLLYLAHLLGRPLERRSGVEQERAAHASGIATDLVAGLRVLKGLGAENAAVARYRRTSRDSLAATLRAARAEAWHDGAILALNGAFIALVALVGGRLAARGDISVGELVSAVGLAQFLLTPLSMISWVGGELAQGRASAARVASVLAAPPAVATPGGTGDPGAAGGTGANRSGAARPTPVRGRLRLRGVTHGPLRGVDLDVAPGELVGVVTTDPAAAGALLECLAREADPEAGTVELDGAPLTGLHPAEIRAAILPAAHDADLFEGTLIENVTAAATGPADHVEHALHAAAADEVARALPHGAHTPITERGRSLSGGQRQRVALARALAADPPVLLVHDPTTAVDAVTEARVADRLREIRRGRTTVLLTTSPALLAVADRVLVLDGGTVTTEGRHTDLVRRHAAYRAAVLA
ncbi:ABC transporter ATP-binding protein [Allostreptomyces psammosilenae]|uniref:ABC transporter ATP-binding protein n=1 Tax=Allostreptomyces psammosilenae TaxID=1892865 RepID=UPI0015C88868|nr:ABC transporter ATP-binding protein [Allostreptomyces psammosilenae]